MSLNNNNNDNNNNKESLDINELHFIVSYYLYKMNIASLNRLMNKSYCEKIMALVNKILIANYNLEDASSYALAKLFVKISHIYACIILNVNPVITIKNKKEDAKEDEEKEKAEEEEEKEESDEEEKEESDDEKEKEESDKEEEKEESDDEEEKEESERDIKNISFSPQCKLKVSIEDMIKHQLTELDSIYFDKDVDFDTDNDNTNFKGQSEIAKKLYDDDVNIFSDVLIGETIDKKTTSFLDIFELFMNEGEKIIDTKSNSSSNIIQLYALTIKLFLIKNIMFQEQLIEHLSSLFVIGMNPQNQKEEISINMNLNEEKLAVILNSVRSIVLEMNLLCDEFYYNLNRMYEAIIEDKIFKISKLQMENLEHSLEQLSSTDLLVK